MAVYADDRMQALVPYSLQVAKTGISNTAERLGGGVETVTHVMGCNSVTLHSSNALGKPLHCIWEICMRLKGRLRHP